MSTDLVVMETREDLKKYLKETTCDTTIIKLTATWCRPCKMIEPVIHQLNEQYMSRNLNYEYIEVDVDAAMDIYAFFKKKNYTDSHFYVPFKCMTGADSKGLSQFFQICLEQR